MMEDIIYNTRYVTSKYFNVLFQKFLPVVHQKFSLALNILTLSPETFSSKIGVRKGGDLSWFLFVLFLNDHDEFVFSENVEDVFWLERSVFDVNKLQYKVTK